MGAMVWLFDFPLRAAGAIFVLAGTSAFHDLLDERYGLPEGANWLFYGVSMIVVGIGGVVIHGSWFVPFVLAGLWFVLDGAATVQAGPAQKPHKYVVGLDDEDSSEVMLRMQVLSSIHEELREAEQPRTPGEVADAVGLTEERTLDALDYLVSRDQVERVDGDRYRAVPSRWGKATPAVRFARWLPGRLLRPFQVLLSGV
ncbi:hypothetical protein K933_02216 [Candidatus Halobonum tyrrellensis G22]|uniref:Uncharacterized protein n=2 Tax=Candidatus Halobonum TaxID=1431544 RepID=V4HGB4_9EURY|nr:hypothetical protein K933_02216 [Candidatus Halobonum tyrrellensis G22]